jgi:hypothetical protein
MSKGKCVLNDWFLSWILSLMKRNIFSQNYSNILLLLIFFGIMVFPHSVFAQNPFPFTPSPIPTSNTFTPSPNPTPLPTASSSPAPSSPATPNPTSTPIPTPLPSQTPFPTSTPQPVVPEIIEDNNSGGGGPLLDEEDPSDFVTIIPLPQVINQLREQFNQDPIFDSENTEEEVILSQQQTPGEIISPIIPREVLNRIIPTGLYKEDGLHPIDGLVLLIFGVGFIISGISLLRSDVFLPALSDISSFLRNPLRKRWINSY